jgi:4-amino-4-deoxy-L-arabinose transferase-like glycosyltransferase
MKRRNMSHLTALWIIMLVSFALKTAVIWMEGHTYMLDSDDVAYLDTARIWLETGTFTYNDPDRSTVFITPGFPFFVAGLLKLVGSGYALEQSIRIVQTVIVTLSLYMLYRIGTIIWNERTALWGAGLAAFYLPLWLVSNFILTEALFVLALLLLVWAALRAMRQQTPLSAGLFGLAWGFAVYIRPTIALWPGIVLLLLLFWRAVPWKKLTACAGITAVVFVLLMTPWWIRNAEVSGGHFIPLTKSSGNPLLLGSFPGGVPSLAEQRTWHPTSNLWQNDEADKKWAIERIREGFSHEPLRYTAWYTIGKFAFFWGETYYWKPIAGIPAAVVWLSHYVLLLFGAAGIWLSRRKRGALLLISLFGYMTLLHMIYLAHGRYSVVLMPFIALFAGAAIVRRGKPAE